MRASVAAIALLAFASCGGNTASEPPSKVPLYQPGPQATIPVRIVFENQMSSTFVFDELDLRLDDARVLTDAQHALVVEQVRKGQAAQFDVRVTPGDHMIRARIKFIGSGQGTFAYLKNYRFDIRTSRAFTAAPGGVVTMITYELDGAVEERPAVRFTQSGFPAAAPAPSSSSASR